MKCTVLKPFVIYSESGVLAATTENGVFAFAACYDSRGMSVTKLKVNLIKSEGSFIVHLGGKIMVHFSLRFLPCALQLRRRAISRDICLRPPIDTGAPIFKPQNLSFLKNIFFFLLPKVFRLMY